MANIAKIQKPDFSIIVYENPKNLRTIWNALEQHWKYRNTIIWHIPNRVQGFSAKYKFFNKHDIALVGTSGEVALNIDAESDALLQEEYETALFATSGKPHWESYGKGKKYCPTDFIEHIAADEKSSGQGIIFGTKPLEILDSVCEGTHKARRSDRRTLRRKWLNAYCIRENGSPLLSDGKESRVRTSDSESLGKTNRQ